MLFSSVATGQASTDQQIVQDAIRSTLGTIDAETREQLYRDTRSRIGELLVSTPAKGTEVVGATVVFKNGLSPIQVEEFTRPYGFEAVSAQAKYPAGDDGRIATVGIGSLNLMMTPGSLSERLRLAMTNHSGRSRAVYARDSSGLYSRNDRLPPPPAFKVYQLEIVGTLHNLSLAMDQEQLAVLSLDRTNRIVDAHSGLVERMAQMRRRSGESVMIRLEPGQDIEEAIRNSLPAGVDPDRIIINGQISGAQPLNSFPPQPNNDP